MSWRNKSVKHRRGYFPLAGDAKDASGYGNDGTWAASEAYSVNEYGRQAADLNGADAKIDCGDVGVIRTISFWVKPDTITEELILVDAGKDIMVSGGTITYAGLTVTATYVNGKPSTTLVAGIWQHVACVLNADVDANNFEIGTDGTNFGAAEVFDVQAHDVELSRDEINMLMMGR